MKEDLLDLVFEENNVVFRDTLGLKVGERRKTTNIWGNERRVDFIDQYGNRNGCAKEHHPVFSDPYVEFFDKDGNSMYKAYVDPTVGGHREVRYTNRDGQTVHKRYVDEKAVLRNQAVSRETSGRLTRTETGTETGTGGTGTTFRLGDLSIWFWGIIFLLICGALAVLCGESLEAAWSKSYEIHRVVRGLCLYVPAPLVLILQLFRCRLPKDSDMSTKLFYVTQLLLGAAAMIAVAWVLNQVLVLSGDPISGWSGTWLYLQGYLPAAIYGLLSRIRVSLRKRGSENRTHCDRIAHRAVAIVAVVTAVSVFAARMVMIFILKIHDGDTMYFFVRMGWQMLLAWFLGYCTRMFYTE